MTAKRMRPYFTWPLIILIFWNSACKQETGRPAKNTVAADSARLAHAFSQRALHLCPAASRYAHKHAMNEHYFFFIDLSAHSGLKRFAIVDMKQSKIISCGLVAHGAGKLTFADTALFSNQSNSYCSSIGRYKVGGKYPGRFGIAYKLYGLDTSNSNAYARSIVLHAYDCVKDKAIYPSYSCNSLGCPMVSYNFLKTLSAYIDNSQKPLLLWIVGKER